MPITLEQVRTAISYFEPVRDMRIDLGPEALPHLEALLQSEESFIAAKAAYTISRIRDPRVEPLLRRAAGINRPEVRIAVAAGVRDLPEAEASPIVLSLLDDQDRGVRKMALQSVPERPRPELRRKIESLSRRDPDPAIRTLSRGVLQRLGPAQ
jgi:HEAT repeat protein